MNVKIRHVVPQLPPHRVERRGYVLATFTCWCGWHMPTNEPGCVPFAMVSVREHEQCNERNADNSLFR